MPNTDGAPTAIPAHFTEMQAVIPRSGAEHSYAKVTLFHYSMKNML